ncbi:Hypothetical predicted protein [Paramuricea clavata]|uniref:Uncharacterized protein n=1 Tax=Paramuricea clavata TaxID=317549 RepID=A0A6S7KZL6_PARCT|nr:Hypothetical predicted protein [Paramuricea clavata]
MSSGQWNASEPKCEEKCSDPSKGTNARVIGNEFYHGKEVEFVCTEDVILIPESSRKLTCENGKWNGSLPSCKASCPSLSKIRNGVINGGDRTHGSLILFTCNGGYQLIGVSSARCDDGQWSETVPRCLAICRQISTIKNGRVVGSGSLEGEKVTFVCNKNYVIVGQRVLRCTGHGRWNASEPRCEETCPDPSKNTNTKVSGNEFYNGKEVEFVCPKDYVLIPKESRKLKCEKGSWKGIIPSCKASCPAMSKIPNGALNSRSRTHGSFIQFVCNGDYQLIGASNARCNDGIWSEKLPRCIAICRKIFSIKNGEVIESRTLEGDEISFVCNENYLLVGENVLRCTSNGRWNASEPKCKGDQKFINHKASTNLSDVHFELYMSINIEVFHC